MDVVEALRGMAGAYALVVAGRGGRQPAEQVVGLEGWAECAEVGPVVGEILASDESLPHWRWAPCLSCNRRPYPRSTWTCRRQLRRTDTVTRCEMHKPSHKEKKA